MNVNAYRKVSAIFKDRFGGGRRYGVAWLVDETSTHLTLSFMREGKRESCTEPKSELESMRFLQ